tara:strand:- start:1165 stop:1404 length:240 start_codon:yes stop_codon:yes gene_type:complete
LKSVRHIVGAAALLVSNSANMNHAFSLCIFVQHVIYAIIVVIAQHVSNMSIDIIKIKKYKVISLLKSVSKSDLIYFRGD